MARKSRNKISRNVEHTEYSDDEIEDTNCPQQVEDERRFNIIWKARVDMLKYVDDMALPLCDFLDQKIIEEFVEYLANQ